MQVLTHTHDAGSLSSYYFCVFWIFFFVSIMSDECSMFFMFMCVCVVKQVFGLIKESMSMFCFCFSSFTNQIRISPPVCVCLPVCQHNNSTPTAFLVKQIMIRTLIYSYFLPSSSFFYTFRLRSIYYCSMFNHDHNNHMKRNIYIFIYK